MPGYWMDETSGRLRPAIEAYLSGAAMSADHVDLMRAYLFQWIMADGWRGAEPLRQRICELTDRTSISRWLDDALEIGIDPL